MVICVKCNIYCISLRAVENDFSIDGQFPRFSLFAYLDVILEFFERSVHEAKKWADKQKRNVNTIDARRRECANYAKSLLHAKGCSAISNHKVSKEIRKCQQCRLLKCLQIGMTPESMATDVE